jgi:hypothetical protein
VVAQPFFSSACRMALMRFLQPAAVGMAKQVDLLSELA